MSLTIADRRCASSRLLSRVSCSSSADRSRDSATSVWPISAASGVRSSCATSALKASSCDTACSSRSISALNCSTQGSSSSAGSASESRWSSRRAEMARVCAARSFSGRSARFTCQRLPAHTIAPASSVTTTNTRTQLRPNLASAEKSTV